MWSQAIATLEDNQDFEGLTHPDVPIWPCRAYVVQEGLSGTGINT